MKFLTKEEFLREEEEFFRPVKQARVVDADSLDTPPPREDYFEMGGPLTTASHCALGAEQKKALTTQGGYLDDEIVTMMLL